MAVAHDAVSESHTGTTGSTNQASFSWTHTPTGTPRGVLVFTFVNANADNATAVDYGGVALQPVSGGRAVDTATEPGDCKAWFAGVGIPTGAQTVQVTRTNNANVMYAIAITVTAASDTGIVGTPVLLAEDGTLAEQNIDSGAATALRYAAINSGLASPPGPGANSTDLGTGADIDFGTRATGSVRETSAGSGSRPVGFSSGTSDDRAAVHLAIAELDQPPNRQAQQRSPDEANGQRAADVAALGRAIGFAVLFGGTAALLPNAAPPQDSTPIAAESRYGGHAVAVAQANQYAQIFKAGGAAFVAVDTPPNRSAISARPQDSPEQFAPSVFHAPRQSVAAEDTPNRPFYARGQERLDQPAPLIRGQVPPSADPIVIRQWVAKGQEPLDQPAAIWSKFPPPTAIAPLLRPTWVAAGQERLDQPAPTIFRRPPPSAVPPPEPTPIAAETRFGGHDAAVRASGQYATTFRSSAHLPSAILHSPPNRPTFFRATQENLNQPAPVLFGWMPEVFAVAQFQGWTQDPPEQPQPSIRRVQPPTAGPVPPAPALFASPQFDANQPAALIFNQPPPSVAPPAPPLKPSFFAAGQPDLTQPPPVVFHRRTDEHPILRPAVFATQQSPEQRQPTLGRPLIGSFEVPIIRALFARPQDSPEQPPAALWFRAIEEAPPPPPPPPPPPIEYPQGRRSEPGRDHHVVRPLQNSRKRPRNR